MVGKRHTGFGKNRPSFQGILLLLFPTLSIVLHPVQPFREMECKLQVLGVAFARKHRPSVKFRDVRGPPPNKTPDLLPQLGLLFLCIVLSLPPIVAP
ncbi:eukaryotic translation initiation factor 4E [Actinidia rufa]|uniref:Eukaryotic translation initiation factor 4E n=1 Tax=Actinidia rufa TaxID=165716 RepID=A0A7J0G8P8_9ERIC|nr:eukaryotic translation initiation factor 4E [Actinidia rufa]